MPAEGTAAPIIPAVLQQLAAPLKGLMATDCYLLKTKGKKISKDVEYITSAHTLSSNNVMLNLMLKVLKQYASDSLYSVNFGEVRRLTLEVQ